MQSARIGILYKQPATIVIPTGTGKTETMLSALAAYAREPMLVVVPSDALRSQTARKFLTFGLLRWLRSCVPRRSIRSSASSQRCRRTLPISTYSTAAML